MFRKTLSPEALARIQKEQVEAQRIYNLGNRWLAQELLKLAREVQPKLWAEGWTPSDLVYDSVFAWQVIPELAKRLGATAFSPTERTDFQVIRSTADELRMRAVYCLINSGTRTIRESPISREVANGNPVMFAVDRLAPPAPDDPVARHLKEVAKARGVECHDGKWTPSFMNYDRNYSSFRPKVELNVEAPAPYDFSCS